MALNVSLSILPHPIPMTQEEVDAQTIVYPESYARIMFVRSMAQMSYIFVAWYANTAAREGDSPAVKVFEYAVETSALAGDVYPASYAYLKTLPEFSGATDC